ncbi:MAG: hypothetical protein JRF54_16035 [Deltaproteobacteria bacterium]|nr:hypothetical protein [Deltaproteobacteria bacterium]
MSLQGKRVVVGLGGGIAAFKAVELVRELSRRGAEVRVVMTEAATHFVGPITFAGLTGKPAVTDLWAKEYAGEVHVELGEWADAIVIAPATMNLISRAPWHARAASYFSLPQCITACGHTARLKRTFARSPTGRPSFSAP